MLSLHKTHWYVLLAFSTAIWYWLAPVCWMLDASLQNPLSFTQEEGYWHEFTSPQAWPLCLHKPLLKFPEQRNKQAGHPAQHCLVSCKETSHTAHIALWFCTCPLSRSSWTLEALTVPASSFHLQNFPLPPRDISSPQSGEVFTSAFRF